MLKNLIGAYKNEALLFVGAFFVRALYAIGVQTTAGSHGFISFSDAQYFYLQLATNLAHHGAFSLATSAPYYPDAYHTPLYPFFLALLFFLHVPLVGVALVQDVLAALMVVLIYRIAIFLTSSTKIALFASIIAILEPMSVYWNNLLMSDTLFAFLLVLSFYFLVRRQPYLCAAVLGLATLTRPVSLYFFPVFLLMIAYQEWSASHGQKKVWKKVALTVVLFVAVLSPWYLHNKIVFNTWALSSAGWYELYVAPLKDFAQAQGVMVASFPVHFSPELTFERFNFEYDTFYKHAFLSVVLTQPLQYGRFQLMRWATALTSNRYEYLVYEILAVKLPRLVAHIPTLLLGAALVMGEVAWMAVYLLAATAGLEKKLQPWWLFFSALALINLLLSGIVFSSGFEMSRYEMGFLPLYVIFAAAGARYGKEKVVALLAK